MSASEGGVVVGGWGGEWGGGVISAIELHSDTGEGSNSGGSCPVCVPLRFDVCHHHFDSPVAVEVRKKGRFVHLPPFKK